MSSSSPPTFTADWGMFAPQPGDILRAIRRAGTVNGLSGVDLSYPFGDSATLDEVQDTLATANLRLNVLTPTLSDSEAFAFGSFTSPDPAVRDAAARRIDEAALLATPLEIDYVKINPQSDGHDAPFQVNYRVLWGTFVDGLREVVAAHPDVTFGLEYKRMSPRGRALCDSGARALLAVQEVHAPNLGLVIDLGHSLFAGERPADVVGLAVHYDSLVGVEFNDNFREADDSLVPGSVHLVETLEFIAALDQADWRGAWQLDQTGTRTDPIRAAEIAIGRLMHLHRRVRDVAPRLTGAHATHDSVLAHELLNQYLFNGNPDAGRP